jgi:hypothetical protein
MPVDYKTLGILCETVGYREEKYLEYGLLVCDAVYCGR